MEEKILKEQKFEMLKELALKANNEMLVEFCNSEIAMIQAKAEKAKERAAAKKEAGDELKEFIKTLLTDEYQTVEDIYKQIDREDLKVAQVTSKLSALVREKEATKVVKTIDGKRKVTYTK